LGQEKRWAAGWAGREEGEMGWPTREGVTRERKQGLAGEERPKGFRV
jgi:hypothetical protein